MVRNPPSLIHADRLVQLYFQDGAFFLVDTANHTQRWISREVAEAIIAQHTGARERYRETIREQVQRVRQEVAWVDREFDTLKRKNVPPLETVDDVPAYLQWVERELLAIERVERDLIKETKP